MVRPARVGKGMTRHAGACAGRRGARRGHHGGSCRGRGHGHRAITPAGFTLIELLVALMVFSVGVLGAVATLGLAARILREAHARQTAVLIAGAVLDSLAQAERVVPGERREARYRLRWSPTATAAGATEIALSVEYSDGTAPRRLRFALVHLAPVLRAEEPW